MKRDGTDRTPHDERDLDERDLDRREFLLDERERLVDEREHAVDGELRRIAGIEVTDPTDAAADSRLRAPTRSTGDERDVVVHAARQARDALRESSTAPPLVAQFTILGKYLRSCATVEECLEKVVLLGQELLPASTATTISTLKRSVLRTRAATNELGQLIDEMQSRAHEGPSVEVVSGSVATISASLSPDPSWPRFESLAAEVGLLSVLSVCIRIENGAGGARGSLNHYSTEADAFDGARP